MNNRKADMDTMVVIGDKIISPEIFTEHFACDYGVCGGVCCVIGDSGAPMEEDEPERIEANYGRFSPLMSPEGRAVVAEKGFFEIDSDGDMVTPLVPGREGGPGAAAVRTSSSPSPAASTRSGSPGSPTA